MMDSMRQFAELLRAVTKESSAGDYEIDERAFTPRVAQAFIDLMDSPLKDAMFTIHKRAAQFGTFGLYRVSTTIGDETQESPEYAMLLGDIAVPQTVYRFEDAAPNASAIHLGNVAADQATREGVIQHLRKRQEREMRSIEKLASADESDPRVSRMLREQIEKRRSVYARVASALAKIEPA
jgi:hypothetical protein